MRKIITILIISIFTISMSSCTQKQDATVEEKKVFTIIEAKTVAEMSPTEKEQLDTILKDALDMTIELASKDQAKITTKENADMQKLGETTMKDVEKYFPNLVEGEVEQYAALKTLEMDGGKAMELYKLEAQDSSRMSHIMMIRTTLEMYYADYASYPESLNDLDFITGEVPTDPKTNEPYSYKTFEKDGIKNGAFILSTVLESESNKKRMSEDGGPENDKYEVGSEF